MKLNLKKYVVAPLMISSALFVAAPIITYVNIKPQIKNAIGLNTSSKDSGNKSIIDTILNSFGADRRAFAECSSNYGVSCNLTITDICIKDHDPVATGSPTPQSSNVSFSILGSAGLNYYPVAGSVTPANSNIVLNPLTQKFNNYNGNSSDPTPTSDTVNYAYTATPSSLVNITHDPGIDNGSYASTGPYSGLGRQIVNVSAGASIRQYSGTWTNSSQSPTATYNIVMDHADTPPTISSISQDYSVTVPTLNSTVDVPVNITFSDIENNAEDVTLNLYSSADNYTSAIQTQGFSNVVPGTQINHTFYALPVGNYKWKALAIENSHSGTCSGFASADPGVNLSAPVQTKNIVISTSATPVPTTTPIVTTVPATTTLPSVVNTILGQNGSTQVSSGDVVNVTITATNTTSNILTNVALNSYLPVNTTYIANTMKYGTGNQATGGTFNSPMGTTSNILTSSTIPLNGQVVITYQAMVKPNIPAGIVLSVQSSITSDQNTTPIASNKASISVIASLANTGQNIIISFIAGVLILISTITINSATKLKFINNKLRKIRK